MESDKSKFWRKRLLFLSAAAALSAAAVAEDHYDLPFVPEHVHHVEDSHDGDRDDPLGIALEVGAMTCLIGFANTHRPEQPKHQP